MDRIKQSKYELFRSVWGMEYRAATFLVTNRSLDEIMRNLLSVGLDMTTDGFWILNTVTKEERYSPKFIHSIGYEGDHDFPPVMESWMKAIDPESLKPAYEDFVKHMDTKGDHPYLVHVKYNKKHGGQVELICSGAVVDWEHEPIMLGSHEIIKQYD